MGYSQDRQLSDKYLPHAKQILAQALITESSYKEDTERATDLIVLTGKAGQIACRFRKAHYFNNPKNPEYRRQFTVRSLRDSGSETEFSKIMKGFCDMMFYGFMAEDSRRLEIDWWVLLSLHAFREQVNNPNVLQGETPNGDGTYFKWFDISTFENNPPLIYRTNIPELQKYQSNICYFPKKIDAVVRQIEPQNRSDLAMQMLSQTVKNTEMIPALVAELLTMKTELAILKKCVPRQTRLF